MREVPRCDVSSEIYFESLLLFGQRRCSIFKMLSLWGESSCCARHHCHGRPEDTRSSSSLVYTVQFLFNRIVTIALVLVSQFGKTKSASGRLYTLGPT